MEHFKAFAIKGVMTLVVLYLVLGLGFAASPGDLLVITMLLGLLSYIAGDLMILPKTSNLTATAADFLLAFFMIWGLGMILFENTNSLLAGSLFAAFLIAMGEWFFHSYMADKVLHINRKI
ncbi:DUF2512 family protein [Bacillus massilinigeriensis]|uniref:DUF2512 family protein n=1 Tax=Bacillus mediterraneensis TaxID=1805474 RepID=UPI0008F848CC|nr:DUF2512 family protein [Bacillus mediterraneensis]